MLERQDSELRKAQDRFDAVRFHINARNSNTVEGREYLDAEMAMHRARKAENKRDKKIAKKKQKAAWKAQKVRTEMLYTIRHKLPLISKHELLRHTGLMGKYPNMPDTMMCYMDALDWSFRMSYTESGIDGPMDELINQKQLERDGFSDM